MNDSKTVFNQFGRTNSSDPAKSPQSSLQAKSPLTSPDESPISDVSSLEDDEEKHGIRDDKPESRETPEFVDTPDR